MVHENGIGKKYWLALVFASHHLCLLINNISDSINQKNIPKSKKMTMQIKTRYTQVARLAVST
jgi:hypothetical protein